jgi:hypothetical protein
MIAIIFRWLLNSQRTILLYRQNEEAFLAGQTNLDEDCWKLLSSSLLEIFIEARLSQFLAPLVTFPH